MELLTANLITPDEYSAFAEDDRAAARLETYDSLKERLEASERDVKFERTHKEIAEGQAREWERLAQSQRRESESLERQLAEVREQNSKAVEYHAKLANELARHTEPSPCGVEGHFKVHMQIDSEKDGVRWVSCKLCQRGKDRELEVRIEEANRFHLAEAHKGSRCGAWVPTEEYLRKHCPGCKRLAELRAQKAGSAK